METGRSPHAIFSGHLPLLLRLLAGPTKNGEMEINEEEFHVFTSLRLLHEH